MADAAFALNVWLTSSDYYKLDDYSYCGSEAFEGPDVSKLEAWIYFLGDSNLKNNSGTARQVAVHI